MVPESELPDDFEKLNRRLRPGLMAFFLRRLGSHADAEDMTQSVFLKIATRSTQMQCPDAYVFQVAANLLRDRARREKVRNAYDLSVALRDEREVDTIDPLRITSNRQELEILRSCLVAMPERMRNILILSRLENVDRRALAEAYGVSVSTIDRELTRALAMLTNMLRQEAGS